MAKRKASRRSRSGAMGEAKRHFKSAPTCKLKKQAAGMILEAARERIKHTSGPGKITKTEKARVMRDAKKAAAGARAFCERLHQSVQRSEKNLAKLKVRAFGGRRR